MAAKIKKGDYVIVMGAGDSTKWAYALPAQLDALELNDNKQSA